jgi:hypothetical protein
MIDESLLFSLKYQQPIFSERGAILLKQLPREVFLKISRNRDLTAPRPSIYQKRKSGKGREFSCSLMNSIVVWSQIDSLISAGLICQVRIGFGSCFGWVKFMTS